MPQPPPAAEAGEEVAVGGINTAHLWFLYYLLIFYALILVIRLVVHGVDKQRSLAALLDRLVSFVMSGFWGPVLIALPLIAYYLQFATWNEWIGLPAPFSFVPQLDAIVGYGVPFGLGWLLHRQTHLLLDLHKSWLVYFVLAIALTVVCLWIIGPTPSWQGPNLAGTERVVYTAAYMVGIWCWVFAFVGAAQRYLSRELPFNRYLADASYWMYLMHMGTVVFFLMVVRPFDWHWSIKLTISVVGSVPILLLTYHYLVRFTWIGAILNGRRHPRPGKTPPADAAPAAG